MMFSRYVITTIAAFTLALGAYTPAAWAEPISVDATIASNQISLKDAVQLTITIHGVSGSMEPVELPKIEGLDASYVGPSTSISMINGQSSVQKSFNYNLFPSKTGHFQIPAITVNVQGQAYTTQPIDLDVVSAPGDQAGGQGQDSSAQDIKSRIFMLGSTPKTTVYLGEKVPVTIRLLVNQLPLRNIQFPKFEKTGFTTDDIPTPQQYSEVYKGVKYDVVDFRVNVYPTRTGELTLGPVQMQGSLLYRTQRDGDEFFGGLFERYQERPVTVNSDGLKFNVLPLPEEGKPASFNGAVGNLDFKASVSPAEVKVGDPVTLRMSITGTGNFKSIQMPVFSSDRFKVYDAKVKDQPDGKSAEQVIIPTGTQSTEVPVINFSYFDPDTQQYKTVAQGPFPLKVTALDANQEFKAVGFTNLPQQSGQVQQVDYVRQYVIKPIKALIAALKTWIFWMIVLLMGVVVGSWMLWRKFQERLNQDNAFSRRVNAFKHAKQGMGQAEAALNAGKPKDFYHAVLRTLSNYLADKLGQPPGTMSWETARPLLEQRAVAAEYATAVRELFNACTLALYAGSQPPASQMKQDLTKLQILLSGLEKALK